MTSRCVSVTLAYLNATILNHKAVRIIDVRRSSHSHDVIELIYETEDML